MTVSSEHAFLLDGVRTPFGRFGGQLSTLTSRQLGAAAICGLLDRQPGLVEVDAVLLAQVIQAGAGQNPARQAAVDAGVSMDVPAMTLNNVCLGGMSAVADAARRISLDEGKAYIVGGMDSMSQAPHAAVTRRASQLGSVELVDTLAHDGLWCALANQSMGPLSESVNDELGIDRLSQDRIALRSHELAQTARDTHQFADEITAVAVGGSQVTGDEGIRGATTLETLQSLRPAFRVNGTITAGNASQLADGASVGALVSGNLADAGGVLPLARVVACAEVAGPGPGLHLQPASAVQKVLVQAGLDLGDLAIIEINEAFAGVVEASRRALSVPIDIVNVRGGAIALGHPLGGTGLRLVMSAARELQRRGERYAVASMCGGGGQGAAVLIENPQYS